MKFVWREQFDFIFANWFWTGEHLIVFIIQVWLSFFERETCIFSIGTTEESVQCGFRYLQINLRKEGNTRAKCSRWMMNWAPEKPFSRKGKWTFVAMTIFSYVNPSKVHPINFLTVDLAPSAPIRYTPVTLVSPSGVSQTVVTELPWSSIAVTLWFQRTFA
jgi:hypothetical protein